MANVNLPRSATFHDMHDWHVGTVYIYTAEKPKHGKRYHADILTNISGCQC